MGNRVRVLAIDGGGIRGIIPSRFLERLEQVTGRPIADLFDLMVGTSTGGILALGLTKPGPSGRPAYRAEDVTRLYTENGARIFSKDPMDLWGAAQRMGSVFGGNRLYAGNARYFPTGLERVLEKYFGAVRLAEAVVPVVVMSFDVITKRPILFRSTDAKSDQSRNPLIADVARATSAAPTYFPAKELAWNGADQLLIDGGIFANNPAMIGYVEGSILANERKPNEVPDLLLVSLGTGFRTPTAVSAADYKTNNWVQVLVGALSDSMAGTSDSQHDLLGRLLPNTRTRRRYWRFQKELIGGVDGSLDNASPDNVTALVEFADQLVTESAGDIAALGAELSGSVPVPRLTVDPSVLNG